MNFSKKYLAKVVASIAIVLLTACASQPSAKTEHYSGFLNNYLLLKPMKNVAGQTVMGWISPELTSGKYHAVIIDPVEYYPPPKESKDVSADTLSEILEYYDKQLHDKIGQELPIVDKPGPGVARLRVAITAVGTENAPLKAYQYIPIALVVQGVKTAAGARTQDAKLNTEMEVLDSQSGQELAAVVKSAHGTEVEKMKEGPEKGKNMVVLDNVKPILDKWADTAAEFAAKNVKK